MTFRPYGLGFRTSKARWDKINENAVIVDHDFSMSTTGSVGLSLEVADPEGRFRMMPGLWEDGLELTHGRGVYTVHGVEVGGNADMSVVTLHAISEGVAELDGGGMDPGYAQSANVPGWLDETVGNMSRKWAKIIDPNLSDKTVEMSADDGEGTDSKDSLWDAITETAKRCGAWCWFTDTTFFFGKPSWLVDTGLQSEWKIRWDGWGRHTEGLVSEPKLSLDFKKKTWEGREELTLELQDPEEFVTGDRLARNMRPGDRVLFEGKQVPVEDPLWIITEVQLPIDNTGTVRVTCWRPVDPPEIVDESGASSGSGEAGVPDGPIGAGGWDGQQLVNAAEIVKEGQRRGVARIGLVEAIMCAMGESNLIAVPYGDDRFGVTNPDGSLTTSVGLFQQQNSWGSRTDRMDPATSAGLFYKVLVTKDYKSAHDAASASYVIHSVQINADPMHYAKFWDDANKVVDACIAAGTASSGGGDGRPPSGPLGDRMRRSIEAMNGRYIDFDGSFGAQCADVGMRYARDLWNIGMVIGNGVDYWRNGQLMPFCEAVPFSSGPRYGDIASWSGAGGAYPNGGFGHIAIYISGNPGSGSATFLTQNPGPARFMSLSTAGIQGWMRPKK